MKNHFALLLAASAIVLTGCDMLEMPGKMDDLRSGMDSMSNTTKQMNEGVHLQKLSDSLKEMLADKNTMVTGNPAAMIPAGKVFAENATALELAELSEGFLLDVKQNKPDDMSTLTDDLKAKLEHDKFSKLTALEVIMGFAPQATVVQMVQDQILGQGRYELAAYSALMLRALFLQQYRFGIALHDRGIQNLEEMKEAISLTDQVEYITTQKKDVTERVQLHVKMLDPADNFDVSLDTGMTKDMWTGINDDANKRVLPRLDTDSEKNEFQQLKQKVQQKMQLHNQPAP